MGILKKRQAQKQEIKIEKAEEWAIFRACSSFFGFTIEDSYLLFQSYCDMEEKYQNFASFRQTFTVAPMSFMNKDDMREVIINLTSLMKEDIWKILNDTKEFAKCIEFYKKRIIKSAKELGMEV